MSAIPVPNPAAVNLHRLLLVRAIAVSAQVAAASYAAFSLQMALPHVALTVLFVTVAALSMLTVVRLRFRAPVRDLELFGQILIDVFALAVFLYLTGGATNPFITLLLLPLAFAAASLPAPFAWAVAVLTSAIYTLLLFRHVPLPPTPAGLAYDFNLHVAGMWLGFVLSAALIAAFAVRMAATLRQCDRLSAEMRERELRAERVLALGTLAAGAAHELGTPLSTMAVVLKDLRPDEPVAQARLDLLRGQIARCKEILASLSASAGAVRAEGGQRRALDLWLVEIIERWQGMRPGVNVTLRLGGLKPAPQVVAEQTLAQALVSILNNAADASPEAVEFDARWDAQTLTLEIADRGPGLDPDVQARLGEAVVSTKEPGQGLGLGLFLAHTTLTRLGGEVRMINREGGGLLCRVTLPLAPLEVQV